MRISSQRRGGTVIDATIRIGDGGDTVGRSTVAPRGSRLTVGDPAFLAPVIPRAIAVHAAAGGGSVDAVRAAIDGGRGIAAAIEPEAARGAAPTLTIDCPPRAGALEVLIGPLTADAAAGIGEHLRSGLGPGRALDIDERPETGDLRVALPLL